MDWHSSKSKKITKKIVRDVGRSYCLWSCKSCVSHDTFCIFKKPYDNNNNNNYYYYKVLIIIIVIIIIIRF